MNSKLVKGLAAAVVALVITIAIPSVSRANDDDRNKKLFEEQVGVQYLGINNDNVVFRVTFANPTAAKFWLIVKNDAGETIYRKQFSDVNFAKSVSIQRDGSEIHPTFVIRNGENEVARQFEVKSTLTENTIITEL